MIYTVSEKTGLNWQWETNLPPQPLSGGPDGLRLIGTCEVVYTSPRDGGLQFGSWRTGAAEHGQQVSFPAGTNRQEVLPIYAVFTWSNQEQGQVVFALGSDDGGTGQADVVLHSATITADLERAGSLLT